MTLAKITGIKGDKFSLDFVDTMRETAMYFTSDNGRWVVVAHHHGRDGDYENNITYSVGYVIKLLQAKSLEEVKKALIKPSNDYKKHLIQTNLSVLNDYIFCLVSEAKLLSLLKNYSSVELTLQDIEALQCLDEYFEVVLNPLSGKSIKRKKDLPENLLKYVVINLRITYENIYEVPTSLFYNISSENLEEVILILKSKIDEYLKKKDFVAFVYSCCGYDKAKAKIIKKYFDFLKLNKDLLKIEDDEIIENMNTEDAYKLIDYVFSYQVAITDVFLSNVKKFVDKLPNEIVVVKSNKDANIDYLISILEQHNKKVNIQHVDGSFWDSD